MARDQLTGDKADGAIVVVVVAAANGVLATPAEAVNVRAQVLEEA